MADGLRLHFDLVGGIYIAENTGFDYAVIDTVHITQLKQLEGSD